MIDPMRMADVAVDAARATIPSRLSTAQVAAFDTFSAGYPLGEQLRAARGLLSVDKVFTTPLAVGPLRTVQRAIEPLQTSNPMGSQVLAQVRGHLDTEIARIQGRIPSEGYKNYPMVENVGAIKGGLDLLDRLGAFAAL